MKQQFIYISCMCNMTVVLGHFSAVVAIQPFMPILEVVWHKRRRSILYGIISRLQASRLKPTTTLTQTQYAYYYTKVTALNTLCP